MKHTILNTLLLLSSLLLSFIIAEFVLRTFGYENYYWTTTHEKFWHYHPIMGWHHQSGQKDYLEKPQFRVKVNINQKGLRDIDYPYKRIQDKKRILVLGDSFVWGWGVEQEQIFTEQMERLLSNVEVINAGVAGYSTDQELLWLRYEGARYTPDLVVLVMCGNDDYANNKESVYIVHPKPVFTLDEDNELKIQNVPVPIPSFSRKVIYFGCKYSSLVTLLMIRVRPRLIDLLKSSLLTFDRIGNNCSDNEGSELSIEHSINQSKLTLKLLDTMKNEVEEMGARFLIISTSSYWISESFDTYEDFIRSLRENHFDILDLETIKGYNSDKNFIKGDGHWNKNGHLFVAEQVMAFLNENRIL